MGPSVQGANLGQCSYQLVVKISLKCSLFVSAELTVTDLRYNNFDTESANMLATIAKEKGISLCGITPGQTEADFSPSENKYNQMGPADAILLTADIFVRAELTNLS